jgi:hypothetical protein
MTDAIATLIVGLFVVCVMVLGADAVTPRLRRWREDRRAEQWEQARFAQMKNLLRRRDE